MSEADAKSAPQPARRPGRRLRQRFGAVAVAFALFCALATFFMLSGLTPIAVDDRLGDHKEGEKRLLAHGRLADFRAAYGWTERRDGGIAVDPDCARVLGVEPGQTVTHVARW